MSREDDSEDRKDGLAVPREHPLSFYVDRIQDVMVDLDDNNERRTAIMQILLDVMAQAVAGPLLSTRSTTPPKAERLGTFTRATGIRP